MDKTNAEFSFQLLFTDPITEEELRPFAEPENLEDGGYVIYVENEDKSRKWKHTIITEEM